MSTSAQRTRSRGAQTKSALGIGENCYLRDNRLKCKRGGDPMLRSALLAVTLALVASVAAAQGAVKIAILGPMAFVQGENHWAGAEMARDEINKAGGINVGGRRMQVELIRADTNEIQSVPDATNAIERVITRDKADFLIGGFRSEAVLAMQEVAMDYKKIFLGAGAAHSKLGLNVEQNYERYKYWFRVTPVKDVDLARTLFAVLNSIGSQIRTDLKTDAPKVAILAEKAVWTEALVAAAQKNLPAMKMEVPTYNAATYDGIMVLKAAIEQAGSTAADKLVPVIEKMEHVGTAGTDTWDKRHDLVWAVGRTAGIAVQWQDGKKVPFWPPDVKGMQPFKMPKP